MDEYDSWLSDAYGGGDNIDYSQFDIGNIDLGGLNGMTEQELRNLYGESNYVDDVSSALQYYSPEEIFNAAKDSQRANELFDDQAILGYGDSATPSSVIVDGTTYGSGIFNAAKDSQAYNEALDKEKGAGTALKGYRAPGATPSRVTMGGKTYSATGAPTVNKPTTHSGTNKVGGGKSDWLKALLPLMLMMAMRDKQSGGSKAVIPALTAVQKQTPYSQQRPEGYRPGQGGIRYFEPVQYMPRMAGGGIVDLARALAAARREQRSRLLKGRGDGVSDSIPATIDGERPARLARGEYVVDARTVAELGNGSTDAGAERLDEMRRKVLDKRKKAGVGQDSKAYKHLPA